MSDYFEVKKNPNLIEIPEGATNGDMIKTIFPNRDLFICRNEYELDGVGYFDENWWNSPYRKEQE